LSFVLDNSVSMRWLLLDGSHADLVYAKGVSTALDRMDCIVPALWKIELANGIARAEAMQVTTRNASDTFLSIVESLRIVVDEESQAHSLTDALDLARKHRLTAYDATYLEVAIRRSMPIASLDQDLLKAAKKTGVERFVP